MAGNFDHLIPISVADEDKTRELARKMYCRPSLAVALCIDWAIEVAPPPDPEHRTEKQLHVHLPLNYREEYQPQALGQFLHLGLRHFWRKHSPVPLPSNGRETMPIRLPETTVNALRARAFREGVDFRLTLSNEIRAALISVLNELPHQDTRSMSLNDVPITQEMVHLYRVVMDRAAEQRWDVDDLMEKCIADSVKKAAIAGG